MADGFTFEEAKTPSKGEGFSFEDASKPSDEPSFFRQIGRQLGLTARAAAMGATYPGRVVGDTLGMDSSGAMSGLLTKLGLPEPSGSIENVSQDVAGAMAGVGGVTKLAGAAASGMSGAAKAVTSMFADSPGMQIASAGTGAAGAGTTRELGGGPIAQTGVGLATGVLPFAGSAVQAGTRGTLRGGEPGRQKFEKNVKLYERTTGETPTVGQANENLIMQGAESGLSRFPGGNMPMINRGLAEEKGLGTKVEQMASSIAPPTTKMSVGKQIEEGISGPGGYMDEVKATTAKLYGKLDTLMGPDAPVAVTNTQAFLDKLAKGKPGAENILKTLQNAKVIDLKGALEADLGGTQPQSSWTLTGGPATTPGKPGGTTIPFSAWQQVRSRIGELIGDPQLTTDIPKRQLRALYANMTKDMEAAAVANDRQLAASGAIPAGKTPTADALERANKVTKLIHDRIDEVIQPVMNAGGPEKLYNAALSGTRDGDTTLRNVMRALPEDARNALTADFFRRLGRAPSSAQNAQGNAFSTERFLTQWNNLSPEAKRTMTAGLPGTFKTDLNDIVAVSDKLRAGSSVFRNPSGSGQAIVAAGTAGAMATSALMTPFVGPGPLITASSAIGSTYAAARLFTSPTFVHWLAKSTRAPTESIPAQINILANIAAQEKDPEMKKAMSDYLAEVK